ncbi:hypothetical protein KC723_03480 [Candidatus Kaiserbacteria bacterium]|nr:hypothetical protein [Candidatus Kaiserbacteria bacterium]
MASEEIRVSFYSVNKISFVIIKSMENYENKTKNEASDKEGQTEIDKQPALDKITPEIEKNKDKVVPSEIGISNIDDFVDEQSDSNENESNKPKYIN